MVTHSTLLKKKDLGSRTLNDDDANNSGFEPSETDFYSIRSYARFLLVSRFLAFGDAWPFTVKEAHAAHLQLSGYSSV
jgi:hypothetical protein